MLASIVCIGIVILVTIRIWKL